MINSERLKDARENLHLTQYDLGKKIGISNSAYSRYENETDNFPIKQLIKVCGVLNISLDYVFDFVNFENYINNRKECNIKIMQQRIYDLRKKFNLTQEELSNVLNTNRSVISKCETGNQLLSTPFLYTICKKYRISADYLLGKIDNPKYIN